MRAVYIDESQRKDRYAVAAAVVASRMAGAVRREVQLLGPRGCGLQRRHFVRESAAVRRKMLAAFRGLVGLDVLVYEVIGASRPVQARERCVDLLIAELLGGGISRVVLDHVEDAQRRRDRQVLARRLDGTAISYGHEPAHSREPMLWVPDAIAWCAGRSEWRRELAGWVTIRRA